MNINISYYTSKGKRPNNEDAVSILEGKNSILAIVADGLGGHEYGEIASQQAVTTINNMLQNRYPDEELLIDAIQQANTDIYAKQSEHKSMRTTVATLWLNDSLALVANVGDSRIYQFRDGKIVYQSLDHSVAQMAVLVGELDKDQIRTSKDRNRLIRALGNPDIPKVDSEVLSICSDDHFLLCSDGFWEAVTEENMLKLLAEKPSVKEWLNSMRNIVEDADNPNQDNHTAVVLSINNII